MKTIEVSEHDIKYWQYEYEVVAKYIIPLLKSWGLDLQGKLLLDIGCAYGGSVAAFYDVGMMCKGYDIETPWVEVAKQINKPRTITLLTGNIYDDSPPFMGEQFDFVFLHDVFEHLIEKERALEVIKTYLGSHGKIILTFPPYYSAYGAHQQIMKHWFAKIPYIHLVPFMISGVFPRLKNESPQSIKEIRKLNQLRMGIKKFEKLLSPAGLSIEKKQAYLISPNHARFGLKPIPANFIAALPVFGELLISGIIYLLSAK